MFRSLIAFAVFACILGCNEVRAQSRSRHSFHTGHGATIQRYEAGRQYGRNYRGYRVQRPSSSFGFSIGIGGYPRYGGFGYFDPYRFDGYGYDPYRYGSFEAPDLLNDPYFRERYRYDSKYPGRYRAPLVMRSTVPAVVYEANPGNIPSAETRAPQLAGVDPDVLAERLQKSTSQLVRGLASQEHGDGWINYLAPAQIPSLVAAGDAAKLRELLTHYDGVVSNPELHSIANTRGFADTRSLLRHVVSQPAAAGPALRQPEQRYGSGQRTISPQRLPIPENLPTPAPEPDSPSLTAPLLDI